MGIGERIRERRLDLGLTLEDVAKKSGVSRQTIQRYESGVISNIPSDRIEKIAESLRVSPSYLMGWEKIAIKGIGLEEDKTYVLKYDDYEEQRRLLSIYRLLNKAGKNRLIDYAELLRDSDKYNDHYDDD